MIKELVLKNRSYRSYDRSVKIKKDTLVELIDIARVTPSAMNLQPLLYVPLTESYADKILPYTNWAKALKNMTLPPDGKGPGAFILLCIDKERTPNPAPVMRDVGIVAQTMLLAATEMGFGGLMIGKFMCFITGGKINPLIGSAGVSAVPIAARVSQMVGQKENPSNFLLMHAMGPNVAGVIGSAVAAGFFLTMIH